MVRRALSAGGNPGRLPPGGTIWTQKAEIRDRAGCVLPSLSPREGLRSFAVKGQRACARAGRFLILIGCAGRGNVKFLTITSIFQTATCAVVRRRGRKKEKFHKDIDARRKQYVERCCLAWHSIAWHVMARHGTAWACTYIANDAWPSSLNVPVAGRVDHPMSRLLSDSQQGAAFGEAQNAGV